jgi:acyl-CoA thioester hydrolase
MNDFTHKFDLRIDWSEIDQFGHVNNLAILKYIQSARVNLLEQMELMQLQAEKKKGPILASMNSQFRKPLFYPGNVSVLSKVNWIKNSSFSILHKVVDENDETAAEVQDIIVFYDFIKNSKLNLPDDIREKIETYKS